MTPAVAALRASLARSFARSAAVEVCPDGWQVDYYREPEIRAVVDDTTGEGAVMMVVFLKPGARPFDMTHLDRAPYPGAPINQMEEPNGAL